MDRVKQFLEKYYNTNGGIVQIPEVDEAYMEMIVSNIKREVVKEENLWEKLQISLILISHNNSFEIRCFVDGQFAAGFATPTDEGYFDMEPKYINQLQIYTGELLVRIREYLQASRRGGV